MKRETKTRIERGKVSSHGGVGMAKTRMSWTQADGKALRKERTGLGVSQAQLGQMAGVTGSRVCEVETVVFPNGRRCTPALKLAEKLAKALDQARARAERTAARTAKTGKATVKTADGKRVTVPVKTDRERQVAAITKREREIREADGTAGK